MACRLLLSDVEEIAKKVGQEFQRLIEEYGGASIASLIPTVVNALEHLEVYVQGYQKLQTQNYKMLLETDSLATEREARAKLEEERKELVQQLCRRESEAKGLALQVERLLATNEKLNRTIDQVRSSTTTCKGNTSPVPNGKATTTQCMPTPESTPEVYETVKPDEIDAIISSNTDVLSKKDGASPDQMQPDLWRALKPSARGNHHSSGDVLENVRMHRRLSLTESQLEKTRSKLKDSQQTLERFSQENHLMKVQLEAYRAEAALQSVEEEKSSCSKARGDKPKFYKRDLLAVLREKNAIKEELDSVREELVLVKSELKRRDATGYSRPRTEARVREILDSFTESVHVTFTETTPPPPP